VPPSETKVRSAFCELFSPHFPLIPFCFAFPRALVSSRSRDPFARIEPSAAENRHFRQIAGGPTRDAISFPRLRKNGDARLSFAIVVCACGLISKWLLRFRLSSAMILLFFLFFFLSLFFVHVVLRISVKRYAVLSSPVHSSRCLSFSACEQNFYRFVASMSLNLMARSLS